MKAKTHSYTGWVLITREEVDSRRSGSWYVAWHELFRTKKDALAFAKDAAWARPYSAVRGTLSVAAN